MALIVSQSLCYWLMGPPICLGFSQWHTEQNRLKILLHVLYKGLYLTARANRALAIARMFKHPEATK